MTTATFHHNGFSARTAVPSVARRRPSELGPLARLWDAVSKASRRREEAEIAHYIQLRGGKMTDTLERDIERRFMFSRF
jgi:hypothetical protein